MQWRTPAGLDLSKAKQDTKVVALLVSHSAAPEACTELELVRAHFLVNAHACAVSVHQPLGDVLDSSGGA